MKPIRYIISVILSLLLAIFLLCDVALILGDKYFLQEDSVLEIIDEKEIVSAVSKQLSEKLTEQENTTGMPKEVVEAYANNTVITNLIQAQLKRGFDYMNKRSDQFSLSMDYSELEKNIEAYFSDYAEQGGYAKDEVYQNKLNESIKNNETLLSDLTDVLRFSSLYRNGLLDQVRKITPHMGTLKVLCIIATVIFAVILCLLWKRGYWLGISMILSGLTFLIPTGYLLGTDYFSQFVIKAPAIFYSVTGLLKQFCGSCIWIGAVFLVLGVVLLFIRLEKTEAETTEADAEKEDEALVKTEEHTENGEENHD